MSKIKLDRSKTALLLADFHNDSMGQNPIVKERHTLARAREVLEAARTAAVFIVYIVVNFRPGYPELSGRNKMFSPRKSFWQLAPMDRIHPSVLPRDGEPIVVKHRESAFFGTELEMMLRARGIDTLLLMGHSTSGVILSTVRYAADADYELVVVEDGCADHIPEVHKILMEVVFPQQAFVVSAQEVVAALVAG